MAGRSANIARSLASFLDSARDQPVDVESFERLVLVNQKALGLRFDPRSASDAVRVLARALELNPDELVVLRWFTAEALPLFGVKTPAELTIEGKVEAVLNYIDSIADGSSG